MNIFTFTGNLGKDCEIKYAQSGTAICSFSVAVASGYGDNKKTTWVGCSLFGKRAEGNLPQYLTKGAQVAISGELSMDEWQKDGVTNKMLKVNVGSLDLIGGKAEATNGQRNHSSHQGAGSSPPPQAAPQPAQGIDSFDPDLPF